MQAVLQLSTFSGGQQVQARSPRQVMGVDRVGNGFETEEVLPLWAEQQKYISAFCLADKLITGILLNDACATGPVGEGIVDELLG